jgi:oxygen-independent coproporphyrinogen-3 oxidase
LAGIYLHIPFCKQACFYCDFHFSVSQKWRADLLLMMEQELVKRANFFTSNDIVETIYFGGGTPSLLSIEEIASLLNVVKQNYKLAESLEITLESNPDDLYTEYLQQLFDVGVNRLSIGIQSFDDEILKWMNRSHNNAQSLQCIEEAGKIGFKDLTIDLIYGVPGLTKQKWEETVDFSLQLPINHLSAYGLTLEQNTPYAKLVKQKKYVKPSDDAMSEHFEILTQKVAKAGWEHYEVSNYCKQGNYSKHNTAYWQQKKYLGIGPSAHSYDLNYRIWNVSNNAGYVQKMQANEATWEQETLSIADKINERLLTDLRTKWGVNLLQLKNVYGYDIGKEHPQLMSYWQENEYAKLEDNTLFLTEKGWLFADYISSQLFVDEDYSSHTLS